MVSVLGILLKYFCWWGSSFRDMESIDYILLHEVIALDSTVELF